MKKFSEKKVLCLFYMFVYFFYFLQNLQGHSLMRLQPVGSPGSPSPNTSQNMQTVNQPWLSSGSQGKPPLPSPSNRHQVNSQMQQRAHLPQQQHHPLPTVSQQQHMPSLQQQQPTPSSQLQEHYGQQFPPSRVPQAVTHQPQITRVQGSGNQKPSSLAMVQPNTVQAVAQNRTAIAESDESCNRILGKRSIHELVSQVSHIGLLCYWFTEKSWIINHEFYLFFGLKSDQFIAMTEPS